MSFNILSVAVFINHMFKYHDSVSRDLADLKRIETMPAVRSVNIQGNNYWDILWQNAFLLRKKQYFETSTYHGRFASNLDGEWDLLNISNLTGSVKKYKEEIIPVNSTYILKKSNRLPDNTVGEKTYGTR